MGTVDCPGVSIDPIGWEGYTGGAMEQEAFQKWIIRIEAGLILALVCTVCMFVLGSQELQQHTQLLAQHQHNTRTLNQLMTEAVQYRQINPAIDPLLRALGIRVGSAGVDAYAPSEE